MRKVVWTIALVFLVVAGLVLTAGILDNIAKKQASRLCDSATIGSEINILNAAIADTQPDALDALSFDEKHGQRFGSSAEFASDKIQFNSGTLNAIFRAGGVNYHICKVEFKNGKIESKRLVNSP